MASPTCPTACACHADPPPQLPARSQGLTSKLARAQTARLAGRRTSTRTQAHRRACHRRARRARPPPRPPTRRHTGRPTRPRTRPSSPRPPPPPSLRASRPRPATRGPSRCWRGALRAPRPRLRPARRSRPGPRSEPAAPVPRPALRPDEAPSVPACAGPVGAPPVTQAAARRWQTGLQAGLLGDFIAHLTCALPQCSVTRVHVGCTAVQSTYRRNWANRAGFDMFCSPALHAMLCRARAAAALARAMQPCTPISWKGAGGYHGVAVIG